jgi:FkbM family methyltransferase
MCALGAENKLIDINRAELIHCGSHTVNDTVGLGKIPMLMIDTLKLDACDLIQLDVEGYEGKVLEGAIETIIRYKPVITVETMQGVDYPDVLKIFNMLAYEKVDFTGSDSLWTAKW